MEGSNLNRSNLDHDRQKQVPIIDFFDMHSKENTQNASLVQTRDGIDILDPGTGVHVLKPAARTTPIKAKVNNKRRVGSTPATLTIKSTQKSPLVKNQNQTPHALKRKKNPTIMSSLKKKGGKLLKKTLTPPRHLDVGCGKTPKRPKTPGQKLVFSEDGGSDNKRVNVFGGVSSDDDNGVDNLTLSPKFKNAEQYEIRSCELDPSAFQLEIPSHDRVLANCKLCVTMDNYVELVGVDFDFSDLMPWGQKKVNAAASDAIKNSADSKNEKTHSHGSKERQILDHLQSAISDIVVEGFFREYYEDQNMEDGLGRVEVCVFSSHALNQIFVVYRGSSDVQDRPINGFQMKKATRLRDADYENKSTSTSKRRKVDHDLNALILDAYHCNLEGSVFTLLHRLTGLRPFCDVTMVGHSFGGALASIAAYKYAKSRPATRVRCQTFGCPRLGGADFRNDVHSLPNLNVTKIERSTDPFISMPEGTEWNHVGHTLRINQSASAMVSLGMRMPAEARPVEFQLYRFDKHRPGTSLVTTSVNSVNNLRKLKIGNEIKSYQKDLDKVDSLNLPWVDSFVGFETEGKQISSGYYA